MNPAIDRLEQFRIPDALRFETTSGGLVRAVISTPLAEADLYLQGAHLNHWTPHGQRPVLFVSPKSLFMPGKAIRGGVPVIFPWFGPRSDGKSGPAHGFARTLEWTLEETHLNDDGRVEVALALEPNATTTSLGYSAFRAQFRVTIGSQLQMELEVTNESPEPLIYEDALHTYFSIADIHQTWITGLEGTTYFDKTDGARRKQLRGEAIRVAKETDQVHVNTGATCVIHDPAWNRRIVIAKSGSNSTVVWNPWIEKTKSLADMSPEDWKEMICVESANAGENAVHLAGGASHNLVVSIHVE